MDAPLFALDSMEPPQARSMQRMGMRTPESEPSDDAGQPRRGAERAEILTGTERTRAISIICANHYTGSVPSGKSYYVSFGAAFVVWSIPANKNIAKFVLGWPGNVWELSRLWAPDGHEKNLLTRAISAAVDVIRAAENPDALVSYADPNAGHKGGIYRAASWIYHGKAEEVRTYRGADGKTVARRAFHSGGKSMTKAQIEALGYVELKLPGKERFVRPLSRKAKKSLVRWAAGAGRGAVKASKQSGARSHTTDSQTKVAY